MTNIGSTSRIGRGMTRVSLGVALAALFAFTSQTALAGPDLASGELLVAKGVIVNDTPATGGLTVLSGSHIKTRPDGRAIVNLGKLGRVMLGSEAEIALTFSEGKLSGEMVSGWAIVNAPKGVSIAIKTVDGIVAADGDKASVLRIDLTGGTTRVEAEAGAQLSDGQKAEFVAAGEEVELSHENGVAAYARRTVDLDVASTEAATFAEILAASVRGAIESVILDRTVVTPSTTSPETDLARRAFANDTAGTQLIEQEVTCGDFNELCGGLEIGCQIFPQIIKAKAGCTLGFILRAENVLIPAHVTIKPFMNSACFRLTPTYPQVVTIPPGGSYGGQINARNCPRNAYQYAQNTLIQVESDTCGTAYIRVEWATPCI